MDHPDTTTGYVTGDDLYPPITLHTLHETPGQAARDLMEAIEADVTAQPSGDGLVVLAHAQGLIEEALR